MFEGILRYDGLARNLRILRTRYEIIRIGVRSCRADDFDVDPLDEGRVPRGILGGRTCSTASRCPAPAFVTAAGRHARLIWTIFFEFTQRSLEAELVQETPRRKAFVEEVRRVVERGRFARVTQSYNGLLAARATAIEDRDTRVLCGSLIRIVNSMQLISRGRHVYCPDLPHVSADAVFDGQIARIW